MALALSSMDQRVFGAGKGLEVARIDTRAVPAKVVKLVKFRDRAYDALVGCTVGQLHATRDPDVGIPVALCALP